MRLPLASTSRRPVIAAGLVIATLSGSATALPVAAAEIPTVPILWEGEVVGENGTPASASVAAFARPPVNEIQDGVPLTEIARTRTDHKGRFVLRAAPASLAGVANQAGWASVMVVATGSDGMALAVDSVSWKPFGPAEPFSTGVAGTWVTTPQALLADPISFAKQGVEPATEVATERPRVLKLDQSTRIPFGKRPAGRPPKGERHCAPTPRSQDLDGIFPVAVGELHRERQWGGEFVYKTTNSSSFQVGGSADGKHWRFSGSGGFSKTEEGGAGGYERPENRLVFQTVYAEMVFTKFEWVCGEPDWYKAYTLEPSDWSGGMQDDEPGVNPTTCNPSKKITVPAGDYFGRVKGTSQTLEKAISVDGFIGSVTTGFTMDMGETQTTGVGEKWVNESESERFLCGDKEFPRKTNTRVVSLP